jgi:hypothetical protein
VLAVYIQSLEEWVFITYRLQYVYVMDIGLIAGLAMQMGFWRRGAPARLTTLRDAVSQPST